MKNKTIRRLKIAVITAFALGIGAFYWSHSETMHPLIFAPIFALLVALWLGIAYVFAACFVAKWSIQRRLAKVECSTLKNIRLAKLKAYRRSRKGEFVTMVFYSAGVPASEWEKHREAIQSAINYTIIGEIKASENDLGIIIFDAFRGGKSRAEREDFYDEEL
ncbi:MAG: hypothetical protein FWB93_05190 [Oscillospiraceae bacterium]|nr:hypothetical protein [Oscillospiraceae bacterium]